MEEVSQAITGIYNMGFDLGTIIPIQGVLWAGDPLSMRFSIGGPDQRVGAPLGGLLGILGKSSACPAMQHAGSAHSR